MVFSLSENEGAVPLSPGEAVECKDAQRTGERSCAQKELPFSSQRRPARFPFMSRFTENHLKENKFCYHFYLETSNFWEKGTPEITCKLSHSQFQQRQAMLGAQAGSMLFSKSLGWRLGGQPGP